MKFILYDVETTGLNVNTCAMHQLSGLILDYDQERNDFQIVKEFDYHMKPLKGKEVTQESLDLCKVTMDQLREYPDPKEVFNTFQKDLGKFVNKYDPEDKFFQVGYNINFDKDVLRNWFSDLGDKYFGSWFWPNVIDLMSDASRCLVNVRPYMRNFKLGSVAELLGAKVPFDKLHNSLEDVYLSFEVLKKCWSHPAPIPLDDFEWEVIERNLQDLSAPYEEKHKDKTTYIFE